MKRSATTVLIVAIAAVGVIGHKLLSPDQYLQLKLAYELANTVVQPVNRCSADGGVGVSDRFAGTPCNLFYGSVPYGGKCYSLLKQGPCAGDQWLVLDKRTELATCQLQVCPNNHVLIAGVCARLGDESSAKHCRTTLNLIINEYGEAECECPIQRVYYPRRGRCYALYEQGPCRSGHALQIVDGGHGSFADCLPSLCPIPGQVPMTPLCELAKPPPFSPSDGNYRCYNTSTPGPCSDGLLLVDPFLMKVVCGDLESYGIFNSLPGRPCSRGSRRDSQGRCRRELPESGSPDVTTVPPTVKPGQYGNGSVCPDDYVFLSGTCLQIVAGT